MKAVEIKVFYYVSQKNTFSKIPLKNVQGQIAIPILCRNRQINFNINNYILDLLDKNIMQIWKRAIKGEEIKGLCLGLKRHSLKEKFLEFAHFVKRR